ncbi:hypothetical protein RJT34_07286 [Clitoria ternatea]|uniref:Uncharacterized protein n=1 Tax=Clitoria ternatea TaxID=43366 RepID=A0AAN9K4K5_CLITE
MASSPNPNGLNANRRKLISARNHSRRSSALDSNEKQVTISDGNDEIAAMGQKLMNDLKTEADIMKDEILKNQEQQIKGKGEEKAEVEKAMALWSMRKSRTKSNALVSPEGEKKGLKIDENNKCSSDKAEKGKQVLDRKIPKTKNVVFKMEEEEEEAVRPRNLRSNDTNKTERVKFSLQLTKEEIEEDFMKMLGRKPPRRPKRRPRHLQGQLDSISPGMLLTEVTADLYEVPEPAENGKARDSRKKKS